MGFLYKAVALFIVHRLQECKLPFATSRRGLSSHRLCSRFPSCNRGSTGRHGLPEALSALSLSDVSRSASPGKFRSRTGTEQAVKCTLNQVLCLKPVGKVRLYRSKTDGSVLRRTFIVFYIRSKLQPHFPPFTRNLASCASSLL